MISLTNMNLNKSTGNDIVALRAIDRSRTGDAGFYSKILGVSEQALYIGQKPRAMPFETFVWLLWSVKESVFKYLKRTVTDLVFSPAKIVIQRIDLPCVPTIGESGRFEWESGGTTGGMEAMETIGGTVLFGSAFFYFRSKVHTEWIASVVSETENFENTWWGVTSIGDPCYASQSLSVRKSVISKLYSLLSAENLQIARDPGGCPVVLDREEVLNIPVSLAHHDRFVAYSFVAGNDLISLHRPTIFKKFSV
jgi:phosphopantetheinyl transferase (holo-ACP synthase)